MIGKEECMDIWALKRQGYSIRAIARKLGIHQKMVKKYLESKDFPKYRTEARKSGLEPLLSDDHGLAQYGRLSGHTGA
jgi:transposase